MIGAIFSAAVLLLQAASEAATPISAPGPARRTRAAPRRRPTP